MSVSGSITERRGSQLAGEGIFFSSNRQLRGNRHKADGPDRND